MGANSDIQWTHHTFNPWWGCQRVSPGCERCYAETFAKRLGHGTTKVALWGPTAERRLASDSYWRQPLKWNRDANAADERRRVFCASMADVFEDRPELAPWRARLWELIYQTPWLDWQLLTKRPQNIARMVPPFWLTEPRPNVWLGCTVEDRQRAHERIPHLRAVRAAVHFLSCEPLLEDLGDVDLAGIQWLIVGGESGGKARPFDVAWARGLARQCRAAGAAPFVKQLGAHVRDRNDAGFDGAANPAENAWALPDPVGQVQHDPDGYRDDYQGAPVRVRLRDAHGGDMSEWPRDLRVREFPTP